MVIQYRPDIDGLRALAVLLVIFNHLNISLFSGGFIGVDVFFVISGYLITSIIYKQMNEDKFSVAQFYKKRIISLAPALFTVLIVFIITYKRFSLGVTILFSSLAFIVFGVLFRPYFVFMPIVAFPIYLITKIHFKNRWIMALCLGGLTILFLSFIYKLTNGDFFSEMTREELNRNRLLAGDSNADTMIVSPIPITNLFAEAFSILYGFITVNFPINGLRFFYKPQVLAFIVWQILISGIVILRFGKLLSSYPKYKKELWLMSFLLAYFIIQGNFEPDLGSAVRHKIGILPIIYYLFYYDDFKRKD